jgi:hypothetical protein
MVVFRMERIQRCHSVLSEDVLAVGRQLVVNNPNPRPANGLGSKPFAAPKNAFAASGNSGHAAALPTPADLFSKHMSDIS